MPADEHVTRCDLRIPNELYEEIESLAVSNGASIHHRSKKPVVTPTILELIELGLTQKLSVTLSDSSSDTLPDNHLIDEKIEAAIAPILARIEKLECATITPPADDPKVESVENHPKAFNSGFQGKELAARLKCDAGGLSKASKKANFAEWSAGKDPDGMKWRRDEDGKYYPIETEIEE
ncbi:hypothetical protein [[Limnothrix rosea] IAM M-220]|uniref:hypothetical protein n=1 Tax=[Limnothrix rosea] IAM M-220 TaxID=454133 RepID=UPI0009650184|nr:hypothetical protein [[Limnothrix rosea] IAM M-220]OKH11174.1 hypothetical protein NIES208_17640 [[Limnothrix rosea] IAM M-220]